ncbi:alpha-1,4-glucan--maltose-1-phosphate maltosyltransferase [Cesiribacter andamanensis]|uniref:Alpha-1,4-glucan:maltose-1-phosphate maltosyltransferase n=1 Tax=Cesiribacter andamanensis AMV16 TaxID=1279009 RepID=M7MZN0_9BACT|nr:alpha-1,4-glucan--maltose-1-phosphate maltosyltransferase [Cesiribacter andamanensis]EMR01883.1 Alpha-1,4-glucan:maltose-1-phosphate maltosyltransferase 1 [Cesiribacter andamanensis AMV16]
MIQNYEGRKRVIIENVVPQLECGAYPAKRTPSEPCTVEATIFADGHDVIQAKLLYRHSSKRQWQAQRMHPLGNDRWQASFTPDREGEWEYTIQGWIDHYQSWLHGLIRKFEANQDIGVELQIGAQLLEEAQGRLPEKEARRLGKILQQYQATADAAAAVSLAQFPELVELMYRSHEKNGDIKQYEKTLKLQVERERARFSAWYEFFPRSAAAEPGKHGTFRDCIRLLPRIAEMGFDVIYFPPIHPIGEKNRKGKNNALTAEPGDVGSPWAIGSRLGGHKSIHPDLGTDEDFRELVEQARQHGIEIALDYALQCAPDHPYVQEHPQWFKWRPDGTVQYAENPPKKYQDVLPFNFENDDWQNLWQELKTIFDYWIARGVKIFRVDNPHTKPLPFWEWVIRAIQKKNPEVLFLAEAFTKPRVMERLAKVGFTQSYTYFTWRVSKEDLEQYARDLTQTEAREYFRPNFWPNTPDILPPHLSQGGDNAHLSRLILAATMSSNWGMYGPVYEFGLNQPMPTKEEYVNNEKYQLHHWDWNRKTRISEAITRINQIRRENEALQYTHNIVLGETDNAHLFAFAKKAPQGNNIVLVVVNLDHRWKQGGWVKVPLQQLGLPTQLQYQVRDLLSGHTYNWQNEWNYVELEPSHMPAHVLRLELPDSP